MILLLITIFFVGMLIGLIVGMMRMSIYFHKKYEMSYEKLLEEHLKKHPYIELEDVNENWYPLGWIAIICKCGQELTYPLEHIYGINKTPQSITHGACPKCEAIHNVKIEVWE